MAEMTTAHVETTDKDLLEYALNDQPAEPEAKTAETPAEPEAKPDGQARDESGRFASKEAEPVKATTTDPDQAQQPAKAEKSEPDAHVPSWRLREEREQREAAERRFRDAELQWQRQFADLQARLPKDQPQPRPNVFENPDAAFDDVLSRARAPVDEVRNEMARMREDFSRRDAEREHTAEAVKQAYDALDKAASTGDQEALATVARVRRSMHPYGDIVAWHKKQTVYSQIGSDPNAWFEKELERRTTNPEFQATLLTKLQQTVRGGAPGQAAPRNKIDLPPSLSRVGSSRASAGGDDDGDMSDESLFRHALR